MQTMDHLLESSKDTKKSTNLTITYKIWKRRKKKIVFWGFIITRVKYIRRKMVNENDAHRWRFSIQRFLKDSVQKGNKYEEMREYDLNDSLTI